MGRELAISTLMVLATVLIHGGGLHGLRWLYDAVSRHRPPGLRRLPHKGLLVIIAVLGLFALHGVEIWLYGLVYLGLGAVESLREAVYFSTITYGAIGYSDAAMDPNWKLVGAIEGINGLLLIGWSTTFLVTTMMRLRRW